MDPQTYIAAGIVLVTLAVFAVRMAHPGKKRGCGHGCDCRKK